MNFETLYFFFFSSIALTSAIFVIYSTNTIYSVFFLILVFISSTGLLLILEIEFLSIMLIIIYVGAITVLFLFVIMMIDINILIDNKNRNFGYLPIIFLITFLFFLETFLMFSKNFTTYYSFIKDFFFENHYFYNIFVLKIDNITNIETIGQVLYTFYAFFFLVAGIILLIALIGAVTLTKKETKKENYLNKNVYKQLSRNSFKAVYNIKEKK